MAEKQALGSEFTESQLQYAPLAGAAFGGLTGAIASKRKNMLRNALIGATAGGVGGYLGAAGYRAGVKPWNWDERAMRTAIPVATAVGDPVQSTVLNNLFHARGLAGGALGALGGSLVGDVLRATAPNEDEEDEKAPKPKMARHLVMKKAEEANAYYDKKPEKVNVYEAGEGVKNMPIKQVQESHKKCAPGEFGMNKEGSAFAFGQQVKLALFGR